MREPIDGLIQKILSARAQNNSKACAHENLMAAYMEACLPPEEMNDFESHVSECAECQELMALVIRLRPETGELPETVPLNSKKTLFRFSIPIPVLGALLVGAILIAVFFRFANRSAEKASSTSVAEVHQAIQKSEKSTPIAERKTESLETPKTIKAVVRKSAPAASVLKSADSPASARTAYENTVAASVNRPLEKPAPTGVVDLRLRKTEKLNQLSFQMAESRPPAQEQKAAAVARSDSSVPQSAELAAPVPISDQNNVVRKSSNAAASVFPETASRTKISAVQNRISTTQYTGMRQMLPPETAIQMLVLPANAKAAESKSFNGRKFMRLRPGPWVDTKCVEHANAQRIEIAPAAPEYESILNQYPEIRMNLPAFIYWEGKNYYLNK